MMLGAFTLKLKAVADSSLPISHGRLLHAAYLDLVRKKNPDLSERLHDSNVKSFSMDLLSVPCSRKLNGKIMIKSGDKAVWKVTSLDANLTRLMLNQDEVGFVRIGKAVFEIISIIEEGPVKWLPSVLGMHNIIEQAMKLSCNDSITIKFLTPTSFRFYDADYPFPRPDFIFGSLVEKWNFFSDEVIFDAEIVKQIAAQYLIPIQWNGESCRVNITDKKGITGFIGTYTFSLRQLPIEHRQVIFTLALFSMYSGIGRLNAQGMGKVNLIIE